MAKYEIIREIFNKCSGNQMRDVYIEEAEVEDTNEYMERYRKGHQCEEECFTSEDGSIVYDLVIDGLKQRVTFSQI